jgi:hypothetical protein
MKYDEFLLGLQRIAGFIYGAIDSAVMKQFYREVLCLEEEEEISTLPTPAREEFNRKAMVMNKISQSPKFFAN